MFVLYTLVFVYPRRKTKGAYIIVLVLIQSGKNTLKYKKGNPAASSISCSDDQMELTFLYATFAINCNDPNGDRSRRFKRIETSRL